MTGGAYVSCSEDIRLLQTDGQSEVLTGLWEAVHQCQVCVLRFRADLLAMSYAGWMDYSSCLSATERRTTAAKRDDFHSKSLFLVKNKGQWNAKSGPKAAYGNFAMRTKFSERLDSEWERAGRNWSNFAHWHTSTHTDTHTTAAKLVVRITYNTIQYNTTSFISNIEHNNITPTISSQHWDGWKGGGQKNILIVVHPQHQLISIVNVK